jgi:hypothetical protein
MSRACEAGASVAGKRRKDAMSDKRPKCEDCAMRRKAEANPGSLWAKIWRWHTSWCPGWKAYQRSLASPS